MVDITAIANEIHAENVKVGWWDDYPVKTDRHETAMMLVVSEISEAMEGHRKNLMDDHLPEFKMFDVELADALIRLLDLAGAYEIIFGEKFVENVTGFRLIYTIPEQLYLIVQDAAANSSRHEVIIKTIDTLLNVATLNNVDIWKLVALKRAYNRKRLDHKRENRALENGKKF